MAEIRQSNMPVYFKKAVFDQCVLPVLTYGCEPLVLNKLTKVEFRTTQRTMKSSTLGLTKRDRKRADDTRATTQVQDIT